MHFTELIGPVYGRRDVFVVVKPTTRGDTLVKPSTLEKYSSAFFNLISIDILV